MKTISLLSADQWKDYTLLDSGSGERLERWGKYIFRRPDPQVLWNRSDEALWRSVDATFVRKQEDKGEWKLSASVPQRWQISYKDMKFWVEPTPFKHLGVFPEQAAHWDWMREKISLRKEKQQILNLFGYTGGASVACALAGAFVTHVDGSRPAISWAKENQQASGLPDDSIRWILEDVLSFVHREARRGKKYHGIIMDPPAFGHGAKGEVWKFHTHFGTLLQACQSILADDPLFMIVNAYAVSVSSLLLDTMLEETMAGYSGDISCGELILNQTGSERVLSTGIYGKWSSRD